MLLIVPKRKTRCSRCTCNQVIHTGYSGAARCSTTTCGGRGIAVVVVVVVVVVAVIAVIAAIAAVT